MRERYLLQAAVFFSSGIITIQTASPLAVFIAGVLLLYLFSSDRRNHLSPKTERLHIIVMTGIFMLGILRMSLNEAFIARDVEAMPDGTKVILTGRVYSCEDKETYYRLTLSGVRMIPADASDGAKSLYGKTVVITDSKPYAPGGLIRVSGMSVALRTAANDGGFDEKNYFKGKSVYTKVNADSVDIYKNSTFGIKSTLLNAREQMERIYEFLLPGEESGILSAMTLGDKADLANDAASLFKTAGLSHILSISGLHISIVGSAIYELLKKGINRRLAAAGTILIVFIYAIMCGGSISVMRAVWMYAVYLAADNIGENYDSLSAMSAVGIVTLFIFPSVICDIGFIFSYGAIIGIGFVANPITDTFKRIRKLCWESVHRQDRGRHYAPGFIDAVEEAFIFDIAIWAFTAPIVSYINYGLPIYASILGLVLLPLVKPLIIMGLSAGIIGSTMGNIGIIIAKILIKPVHVILYGYEFAADTSLKLPMSELITGCPTAAKVVTYYAALLTITHYLKTSTIGLPDGKRGMIWKEWFNKLLWKRRLAVLLVTTSLVGLLHFRVHSDAGIYMLSVGQGDGIYIESREGVRYFIDGGSSSEREISQYTLMPFLRYHGADYIDCWILSHPDADHYNGMLKLVNDGYRVDTLVVSKYAEETEELSVIEAAVMNNGGRVVELLPGDRFGTKSMIFTCLYPDAKSGFSGTNENSLILWLNEGNFDAIFTGDTGADQERDMIDDETFSDLVGRPTDDPIDILKVAHHGSKYSSSSDFLDSINPRFALISVGKNTYGHPAKETLGALSDRGIPYLTTIDSGQITVRWDRKGNIRYLDTIN